MPKRKWRHAVLVTFVSLFGGAAIAGASTWAVILTNGSHPAEVQSTSVSAPTGGSVTSPTDSSLSLNGVPGSGPTPTGYKMTRNGSTVSSGGCKGTLSTNSCTDSGLAASTLYTYSVDALVGTHWTSVASSKLKFNRDGKERMRVMWSGVGPSPNNSSDRLGHSQEGVRLGLSIIREADPK